MIDNMATSPSDPYKSRIVRGVVRQVRRLVDRGQTTLRRVQVAASWSAQILLYPVYALFQTTRLLGKTVERSQDEVRFQLESEPTPDHIPLTVETATITAETPIQNVLQSLQQLELPANCVVQGPEAEAIRAIASQIATHDLVLVTNFNHILRLPDPHHQAWLRQRLIYEIAVYNRQQRSRSLPWHQVTRALQSITTTIRQRFAAPARPVSAPPFSLLPATDLTTDSPVKQSLLAVRNWLSTTDVSLVKSATAERSLAPTPRSTLVRVKLQVRAIATLLPHRRLVLVSDTNDVLDILSPEQQQFLYQRIAGEIAYYQRYLRLQTAPSLSPLRPPSQRRSILPPVRAFQWLMAWMQSGTVAMATNLFQEASWLACPLPPTTPNTTTAIAPVAPRQLAQPPQNASQSLAKRISTSLSAAVSSRPLTPINPNPAAFISVSGSPMTTLNRDRSADLEPGARSREYIDTDVTWVGYEQSWFERIMRWLDRVFLWIENTLGQLWKNFTRS